MEEQWKPVIGYEKVYEVSDFGQVRRVGKTTPLRPDISKRSVSRGQCRVWLSVDGVARRFQVHAIVARAFIGPCPPKHEVNHDDGNRTNNTSSNLEYMTKSQNRKHSFDVLGQIRPQGSIHGMSKLTEAQALDILAFRRAGAPGHVVARRFSVSESTVSMIYKRRTWRHLHG